MSKKMLKRSLVLSALMAFVITGSAMASNVTNQSEANAYSGSSIVNIDGVVYASDDTIKFDSTNAKTFNINGAEGFLPNGNAAGENGAVYSLYATGENAKIEFSGKENVINLTGTVAADYGSTIELHGSSINIDAYKQGTLDFAGIRVGDDHTTVAGSVHIGPDVQNLKINATNGVYAYGNGYGDSHAPYIKGNNGQINIESKNVIINAYEAGVWLNQNGVVNFGTKDNKVQNLIINAGLKSTYGAMELSGDSQVNVLAKNVEINAENSNYGLRVRRGKVNIGSKEDVAENITIKANNNTLWVFDNTVKNWESSINLFAKSIDLQTYLSDGTCITTYDAGTANETIVNVSANEKLNIVGNIISDEENSTIDINKDIDTALVTIDGDITANAGKINVGLGAAGSTLTGTVTDSSGGINLNLGKGTWNVANTSNVNTVSGDGATIKVSEAGRMIVDVTNGKGAKNFTLLGSRALTDNFNGNNIEAALNSLEETVKGIEFASYGFEEGSSKGEIEAYKDENDNWHYIEKTNVTNSNISDVAALGLMAWRSEMNDMNKRLGELRNANGEHGVWVRMVRGESEYEAVKNQYNTYQLGYDEKLSVDKSWTVGMALTYTDGESSFNGGNGENKHKGLAIYGSKLNDDGSFIDLIAKYARLDHDVEVGTEKGDYEANGYSISAEYGKRFAQGNGLWIEPQVELTYGQVGSADYMVGKNRAVTHEGMESLVGRVGFSLGKDIKQGNVYARASYLYDFEGETEAAYTDVSGTRRYINDDLGGGWWEVGVGANINLSKATYIYADIEKTFGGEVDTNWQWNLGVRYSF